MGAFLRAEGGCFHLKTRLGRTRPFLFQAPPFARGSRGVAKERRGCDEPLRHPSPESRAQCIVKLPLT